MTGVERLRPVGDWCGKAGTGSFFLTGRSLLQREQAVEVVGQDSFASPTGHRLCV